MPNETEKPEANKNSQVTELQENSMVQSNGFNARRLMKAWLATSFELGYGASITSIAQTIKADPSNWYKWLDKDGFVEWWDSQWKKELLRRRWKLDAIGMKKAEKSYRFWKDMMNRTGNIIPEPANIGQQFNTLNIPDDYFRRITKRG